MIVLMLACSSSPHTGTEDAGPFYDGSPLITELSWGCTLEDSEWAFTVLTEHWTGGGRVFMARDVDSIEEHRIRSVGAQADGSADKLSLSLDIVADWRDAVAGASTQWRCDDLASLSFLVTIFTPDGSQRADCRTWGADPLLWDGTDRVEGCQTILEDADTGNEE